MDKPIIVKVLKVLKVIITALIGALGGVAIESATHVSNALSQLV